MALAPWDLVSWQSQSDTPSSSICGELSNSNATAAGPGIRRESYLRATRTPMSIASNSGGAGGLDRNDSFRLSRNCSITMTPLRQAKQQQQNNNDVSPIISKSINNNHHQPISEIFRTPSGEVSLVITDHSNFNNNNQQSNVANGGSSSGTCLIKQQFNKQNSSSSAPEKNSSAVRKGGGNLKKSKLPPSPVKLSTNNTSQTSPIIIKLETDQKSSPLEPTQITPEPSDEELYVVKKKVKTNGKMHPPPQPQPSQTGTKLEPILKSDAKIKINTAINQLNNNQLTPRPPYLSRDIFVLCIVFIFAFSAVRAVQVLQSSVNDKGKVGTMALSVFYLSLAVTVILVPPIFHNRVSDRTLLCVGIFFLFVWLTANLTPHPLILLPAAMLGGAGLTLAWSAQMNAFSTFFRTNSGDQSTLKRFLQTNNTLFALFQSSHIWGNLSVAAILLFETPINDSLLANNTSLTVKIIAATNRSIQYNLTIDPGWYFLSPLFKVDLLPHLSNQYDELWSTCRKSADHFPSPATWASLVSSDRFQLVAFPAALALAWLAVLGFIALLLAVLFFHPRQSPKTDDNDDEDEEIQYNFSLRIQKFIVAHLFQLFDGPHFRLLIPLLFFNGLEQGFLYTDYTKMFLSCMFGLSSVGIAVMVAGVTSCLFSAAASFAAKRSFSREIVISIAAIVHLALAGFLYQWQAYPSIPIVVFIIPIIYGFCDAVWQTHCYVLITKVAGDDHQLAFSNFRILQSLGIASSCILSFVAGLGLKVLILVINLLLSVLCYAILENRIRREELAVKDRERLADAFKQMTMVMGAAGIRSRSIRLPPMKRNRNSPSSPTLATKFTIPTPIGGIGNTLVDVNKKLGNNMSTTNNAILSDFEEDEVL